MQDRLPLHQDHKVRFGLLAMFEEKPQITLEIGHPNSCNDFN
jgi:hypothetical protein